MKITRSIVLCVVILSLLAAVPNQAYAATHPTDGVGGQIAAAGGSRTVPIQVKVVFVGVDPATVDLSYSKWNVNTPSTIYGQVLYEQAHLTGVVYNIQYSYTFASDAFKTKLVSYLRSIEVVRTGVNPWFYYYVQNPFTGYISQRYHSMSYVVYDANKVENWIYSNQADLGGFPTNGWTMMFLNLTELPSYDFKNYSDFLSSQRYGTPNGTAHYFGVNYRDADLGYQLRYRDFMSGWGGVHRFWFDDLSAGPCFTTDPEDLPVQITLQDNSYDLHSPYGKLWFSEYLADYVYQAMFNLITPPLLYEPVYSQKYTFDIHVFDNRTATEKGLVNIQSTVSPSLIKNAFEDLVPYSSVQVSVTFEDLTKYPTLQSMIHSSYKYEDSFTYGVEFGQPQQYGVVDTRPIYHYFQDNLNTFEPNFHRDRSEFTVPLFVFAFSTDTNMAVTGKWEITPIGGIALGDVAFVSTSQNAFQRGNSVTPQQPNKGLAFTHDIIHESGHMLGLPHPFDYGPVGNFIQSPMGYFTYDYSFGQADKDMLQRAHVDSIYLQVDSTMSQLIQKGADVSAISNQLKDVDGKYNQMDYPAALQSVLKAESTANDMASRVSQGPVGNLNYLILGTIVGLIVGFAFAWLIVTRRIQISGPKTLRPSQGRRRRRSSS